MGVDTAVRRIVRVREVLDQVEAALLNGTPRPEGASARVEAEAKARGVPAHDREGAPGSAPAWKERRSVGRREEDRERDLLQRILSELSALRDARGAPRKYVTRTEAQRIIGCGRTKIAELCAKKVFETFKEGKARMVSVASLERYVAGRLDAAQARRRRAAPSVHKPAKRPTGGGEDLAAVIASLDLD